MKTRVIARYDFRSGRDCYVVQKWDVWDDLELRNAYPDQKDWRAVTTTPNLVEAKEIAEAIAKWGAKFEDRVVAEYELSAGQG
jgi:hypothetical protein